MYNTAQDLLDAFRATPETLHRVLQGCTQEQAEAARGGDENWSVVEIICHLRDAEERALERVRSMRDESDPFLAAYNQEQWAKDRNYAKADLSEALEGFLRLRATHMAELEALDPHDWERTGRHEEQGQITISQYILHHVSHDAVHLAQIARQMSDVSL
jgi:hypothetical protein